MSARHSPFLASPFSGMRCMRELTMFVGMTVAVGLAVVAALVPTVTTAASGNAIIESVVVNGLNARSAVTVPSAAWSALPPSDAKVQALTDRMKTRLDAFFTPKWISEAMVPLTRYTGAIQVPDAPMPLSAGAKDVRIDALTVANDTATVKGSAFIWFKFRSVIDGVSTISAPGARDDFTATLVRTGSRWLIDSLDVANNLSEPDAALNQ